MNKAKRNRLGQAILRALARRQYLEDGELRFPVLGVEGAGVIEDIGDFRSIKQRKRIGLSKGITSARSR